MGDGFLLPLLHSTNIGLRKRDWEAGQPRYGLRECPALCSPGGRGRTRREAAEHQPTEDFDAVAGNAGLRYAWL
jgi:hypothetical protein